MKTILCYGDSNTWGHNPEFTSIHDIRLDTTAHWPRLLGKQLGSGYDVIEEGLGGRTTVYEDAASPGRSGLSMLVPIIQSHLPLDMLIFMLGTNDTKVVQSAPVIEIAAGMELLLKTALNPYLYGDRTPPAVLLVSPIHVVAKGMFSGMFDQASEEKSRQLSAEYNRLANTYGCGFLDAADHVAPSPRDGIHLDAAGHRVLAGAMTAKVLDMLG